MPKVKFTFRKCKAETGLRAIGAAERSIIKHKGKVIGEIVGPSWNSKDSKWRVTLKVKDDDHYRNAMLKGVFESDKEARQKMQELADVIASKFDLFYEDDDYDI